MTENDTSGNGTKRWSVLDLFSGLGGFSAAFEESDEWDVVTVDIEDEFDPDIRADVMELRPSDFNREFDAVLASPPCTEFSTMQNLNGAHEPSGDAIALVYHTLGLIEGLDPTYWLLENPRGRLRTFIGAPEATVTYCQYGEQHMKPTDLWGRHPPMVYRSCSYGDRCHLQNRGGNHAMRDVAGKRTAAERAKVPYDLSEAIRDACEDGLRGATHEQATLVQADGDESPAFESTEVEQSGDSHD